jgi:hypothetical protein
LKGKVVAGKASRNVTQMVIAPKPIPDMKGVQRPDLAGRYGKYGGRYVPETLIYALDELTVAFNAAIKDPEFQVSRAFESIPSRKIGWKNLPSCRSVYLGIRC